MPTPPFPTRSDGSFGQVKSDATAATDLTKQLPAAEFNNIANWLITVINELGNTDGSTPGSVWEAILGGGGAGVQSVTANVGLTNSGTATNPILNHDAHTGDVVGSTALSIALGAVTSDKIGTGAVVESKIASSAVTSVKIAPDAVNNTHIAPGSIGSPEIEDNSIGLGKIQAVIGDRILGKLTSTGTIELLTGLDVASLLPDFNPATTASGLAPGGNGQGATYSLRADGSWAETPDVNTYGADFLYASGDYTAEAGTSATNPGDMIISGGASSGAGVKGGPLYLRGGIAVTGVADGGDVYVYGGAPGPTLGGAIGKVYIGGYNGDGSGDPLQDTWYADEIRMMRGFSIGESASAPKTFNAGDGYGQLWPRSSDGALMYRFEDGSDINLTAGGAQPQVAPLVTYTKAADTIGSPSPGTFDVNDAQIQFTGQIRFQAVNPASGPNMYDIMPSWSFGHLVFQDITDPSNQVVFEAVAGVQQPSPYVDVYVANGQSIGTNWSANEYSVQFYAWGQFNFTVTTPPTPGDDIADGYKVGSRIWDTLADEEYVCLDNTASAAVWKRTTVQERMHVVFSGRGGLASAGAYCAQPAAAPWTYQGYNVNAGSTQGTPDTPTRPESAYIMPFAGKIVGVEGWVEYGTTGLQGDFEIWKWTPANGTADPGSATELLGTNGFHAFTNPAAGEWESISLTPGASNAFAKGDMIQMFLWTDVASAAPNGNPKWSITFTLERTA